MSTPHTLAPAMLDEIVRRVVEIAQPERIILFGSAARGEMGPHSDVDLLVVKAGEYRKRELGWRIRQSLRGLELAFDVLLATPEELERYRDAWMLVYGPALREGRELYAA
ncbi:MAG: nucleotidyltransferase domain-containing protein [Gemmatimonadetes bacterium]|nr:nucleotidyltransferase domain-containing protein [Gemmatimonadota bacterium]